VIFAKKAQVSPARGLLNECSLQEEPVPPLRVLIADNHQLFVETLGLTLDDDERVQLAGSACNGQEAVRLALGLRPDAVLMDLDMPVLDGFRATRLLRRLLPACPVVVLTASPSPDDVHRARTAGAAAYLNKGCAPERVVEALVEARACAFGGAADTEKEHQVAQP